jgi:hypothetical protein
MHLRLQHIALLLLPLLLFGGSQAFSQLSKIYVDVTNGSDSYTGANPTNAPLGSGPKASIHAGLAYVANGGTVIIFAGTYPGDGVDSDGSPTNTSDNADIEISSAKYSNISTGLTIELRALGASTEVRVQVDDNTVMAPNGALITHRADAYIPNLVVNVPGGVVRITRSGGAEFLNLIDQHSSGAPTSGIILKAGSLDLSDSSLVRLRSGATITRNDT